MRCDGHEMRGRCALGRDHILQCTKGIIVDLTSVADRIFMRKCASDGGRHFRVYQVNNREPYWQTARFGV